LGDKDSDADLALRRRLNLLEGAVMDEWTIVIMVLVSIFMLSSASVFGYWLKLRYMYRHMPKMAHQLKELRSVVGELQNQVDSQTSELHDCLDFAERVLTEGVSHKDDSPLPTPV
jgi:hypothetical protein